MTCGRSSLDDNIGRQQRNCGSSKAFAYESFQAIPVDCACGAAPGYSESEAGNVEFVRAGNNGKLFAAVAFSDSEHLLEIGGGEQPHGFVERLLPAA